MRSQLLQSFLIGGFESSTMRRPDGRRNDLVAATQHDRFARQDYSRLLSLGISTVREGVSWHRTEATRGTFDAGPVIGRIHAARDLDLQVMWDLCHFGWPDDVDPFAADFADRLASFATWFVRLLRDESGAVPWITPINEPSFVAWAAGDVGYLDPFQRGRGPELKRRLVRAALVAAAAMREIDPRVRICHVDPLVNVLAAHGSGEPPVATLRHQAQFEAWDMLGGRRDDDLGGSEAELDVIGVNFYDRNQWVDGGPTVRPGDPRFRPFREMLADAYERYRRPMVVAETGAEGPARAPWLRYVANEVTAARACGIPIEGLCLYPVVDHPGWDDDRHDAVGIWGYPDETGQRLPHGPLIEEVARQVARFRPTRPRALRQHGASGPDGRGRGGIVLVTDSRAPSGMGHQMLTLARGLARRHRVIVAAPESVDGAWLLDAAGSSGVEVWPLTDGSPWAQAELLRQHIARDHIDLVNVHAGIGWEGHAAILAARAAGALVVVRTEHLPYLLTKPADRARYAVAVDQVDRIIAVSEGVASSYIEAGVPERLLHVVRNGIDDVEVRQSSAAVRETIGLQAAAPLFVSVGRLTAQKGFDVLLVAAAAVVAARPDAQFLIVGSGVLAAELDHSIVASGLQGNVLRLPDYEDVPSLLSASDAFVLASRFEGLPLVALEAMALHRPVIGTRVCGLEETVRDGVTGRLVAVDDGAALGVAVLELLEDPQTAARYGRAGRERYEGLFTARRMLDETEAIFLELVGRGAEGSAWQSDDPSGAPMLANVR